MVPIIGQIPSKSAEDSDGIRSVPELKRTDIFDDHRILAIGKRRIGELELNASTETKTAHVESSATDILHFDIFKIVIIIGAAGQPRWMIHNLRDAQRRQRREERRYGGAAPGILKRPSDCRTDVGHSGTRENSRIRVNRDRARIGEGSWSQIAARSARIRTVQGVI